MKTKTKALCPWCDEAVDPIPNDGSGYSMYGYESQEEWMAKNPAMCPLCNCVGGWEDFGMGV